MKRFLSVIAIAATITLVGLFVFRGLTDDESGKTSPPGPAVVKQTRSSGSGQVVALIPFLGSDFDFEKAGDALLTGGDPLAQLVLDSERFSMLYKEILADESLVHRDRKIKLDLLIKSLVNKVGIHESLEGISERFGEGQIRTSIISGLFRFAPSSQDELYPLISTLEEGEEREWALGGIFSKFANDGYIDDSIRDLFPFSKRVGSSFELGLHTLVASKKLSIDQGLEYLRESSPNGINDRRTIQFLRRMMTGDSEWIVDYCLSRFNEGSDVSNEILDVFVRDQIARFPERGIEDLIEKQISFPGKVLDERFANAMTNFLKTDREQAVNWFEANSKQLPGDVVDGFRGALAMDSMNQGQIEEARAHLANIDNNQAKQKFEGRVWSQESKIVRSQVLDNPQAFLEDVVKGNSPHEEYWIKEGFKTWFSSSPEDANEWYSNQQRSLSPAQSQHVARAYAEVAFSQGDVGLAREWAERVVDPEFKEKLDAQIEAAKKK